MEKIVVLDSLQFLYLMLVFAGTFVIFWGVFWLVASRDKTDTLSIIDNGGFLRIVTVGFTLSAVLILAIAGILNGEIAGAIISGVVGYVLGSNRLSNERNGDKIGRGDTPKKLPPNVD